MNIPFPRFTVVVAILFLLIPARELQAQERKLQFNSDKSFKIVQFTDTHFYKGGPRSQEVLDNIIAVMEAENPDLLILTGDSNTITLPYVMLTSRAEIATEIFLSTGPASFF